MINKGSSWLWISEYFLVNTVNCNVDKVVEKGSVHLWMIVDESLSVGGQACLSTILHYFVRSNGSQFSL